MTDPTYSPEGSHKPATHVPIAVEGSRDLTEGQFTRWKAEIEQARGPDELKRIANAIIEATGYGAAPAMGTSAFARAVSYSGFQRAADLARMIDIRTGATEVFGSQADTNHQGA